VDVVDDHGQSDRRSMVYTEYFAPGTAPTAYCDLHPTRGLFGKIAGLLGAGDDHPAPPRAEEIGLPPASASAAHAAVGSAGESEVAPPPPPKKKRGFWSKLLGLGKDDDQAGDAAGAGKPPKKKGGE
jgi:penicillin-binding protein 1B